MVSECAYLSNELILIMSDYMEIKDHAITSINSYQGGPFQQAISGLTNLNNDWYDGKAYQSYAFDYKTGDDGYITWHVGKPETWTMDARAIRKNGNIGKRTIPEEPLSIIANFGMSNSFAGINLEGILKQLPATMRIDYIRIYQDEDNQILTCDPEGYPTTDYIRKHPEPYANPNMTAWYVLPSLLTFQVTNLSSGPVPSTVNLRIPLWMDAKHDNFVSVMSALVLSD
jgi:hypothetical protein